MVKVVLLELETIDTTKSGDKATYEGQVGERE